MKTDRARRVDRLYGARDYKLWLKSQGLLQCQVCGWRPPTLPPGHSLKIGSGLHVHHIMRVVDGGSDERDNLVCLCPNHHAVVHMMGYRNGVFHGPTDKIELIGLLQVWDSDSDAYERWAHRGLPGSGLYLPV